MDVLGDGPSDVPIEALLDVQGNAKDVADLAPLFGKVLGAMRVDGCVERPDVGRLDRSRVADGLQDAPVDLVHQDDRHVMDAG